MARFKKENLRILGAISSLGIEIGVSIVIGYLIGHYLDKLFNTGKVLTIIFILLGIASGFKYIYSISKRAQTDIKEHKPDNIDEDDIDRRDTDNSGHRT